MGLILSGPPEIEQAGLFQCYALGFSPFTENGVISNEIDIDRCKIAEALVAVVVVLDKGFNGFFKRTMQIGVFQQDAFLECLMPTFNLALYLGKVRSATDVFDALVIEPFAQVVGDVTGAVIAQQPGLVLDRGRRTGSDVRHFGMLHPVANGRSGDRCSAAAGCDEWLQRAGRGDACPAALAKLFFLAIVAKGSHGSFAARCLKVRCW